MLVLALAFSFGACNNPAIGGRRLHTVSGTISADDSGSTGGAVVRLLSDGSPAGTVSVDGDGTYAINKVADGIYTIEVNHSGYVAGTISSFEVNDDVAGKDLILQKENSGPDSNISVVDGSGAEGGGESGSESGGEATGGESTGSESGGGETGNENGGESGSEGGGETGNESGDGSAGGESGADNSGDTAEPDAVTGASQSGGSGGGIAAGEPVPVPQTELISANGIMSALKIIKTKPAGNYRIELPYGGGGPPANYDLSDIPTPTTIVIDGNGYDYALSGGYDGKGSLLTIPEGITIFLVDVALYGANQNTKSVVTINGGTLVMKDGSKIGKNSGPVDGGGVQIWSGKLVMDGGEISGNTGISNGGAVFIRGGGDFIMRGGRISGNQASNCGAVFLYNGGSFVMEGGEISGNTSRNYAGGVLVNGGLFELRGGEIRNNVSHLYGGGVFVGYYSHLSGSGSGVFKQTGGVISGNMSAGGGGGVSVRGSSAVFVLTGGVISDNRAVPDDTIDPYGGGGVFVQDGLFICEGGRIINNETAYELWGGGGILVHGVEISSGAGSGGVDAISAASGGGGSSGGGGRSYQPGLTLNGGEISGNMAGNGMGSAIYAGGGEFALSLAPAISGRVLIEYQNEAAQHILIDGGFTGTTVTLDLRGNEGGISHISNWMKPILGMAAGGSIPAAILNRFVLGTFTPYSGGASVNLSNYKIGSNGRLSL
jgi:hypothetical protein